MTMLHLSPTKVTPEEALKVIELAKEFGWRSDLGMLLMKLMAELGKGEDVVIITTPREERTER